MAAEEAEPTNTQDQENEENQTGEESASEILDLDTIEKFKFKGQEFTPEELQKAILMQRDYTKKTQSLAKDRQKYERFTRALQDDIPALRNDPTLADRFREVYPEEYHFIIDQVLETPGRSQVGESDPSQQALMKHLKALETKLTSLEQRDLERLSQQKKANMSSRFEKMSQKYTMAPRAEVLATLKKEVRELKKAGDENPEVTDSMLERFFKKSHERWTKKANTLNKQAVSAQMSKNREGIDTGRGKSSISARPQQREENKPMSASQRFSQANEALIAALSGKRS